MVNKAFKIKESILHFSMHTKHNDRSFYSHTKIYEKKIGVANLTTPIIQ